MTTNTNLIHAIADALIETHGQDGTEWLECGGRAKVERGVAGWRAAIEDGAWTDRPEDILVLRALRHVEYTVELAGDARIEPRASARSSTRTGTDGGAARRRGLGRVDGGRIRQQAHGVESSFGDIAQVAQIAEVSVAVQLVQELFKLVERGRNRRCESGQP